MEPLWRIRATIEDPSRAKAPVADAVAEPPGHRGEIRIDGTVRRLGCVNANGSDGGPIEPVRKLAEGSGVGREVLEPAIPRPVDRWLCRAAGGNPLLCDPLDGVGSAVHIRDCQA
jgi:hypothetical protein